MKRIKYLTIGIFIFCITLNSTAQSLVSGIVTDAKSGETLIGATVAIKETGNGVTTDFDGKYEIRLDNGTHQLIFSYIGYEPHSPMPYSAFRE